MKDIDKIICQSDNPFESELTPGNFWHEQPDVAMMVDSIHQEVLKRVEKILTQMNKNRVSRTLIISGDAGSGKSYLLGRIKRTLNQKAFFAYISPWPDSSYIWRHILRQTVDSLVNKPKGQQDSQLILWIKSLSTFKEKGVIHWMLGERGLFINNLRAVYPSGIYNAKEFFGVLYDLTNPELYPLACDWLRGDDLDEDDLKKLKVKQSIDSEQAAKNILSNFGKIATDTQPIVLCFDQLDNIPNLDNGLLDLQPFFDVNSIIHSECFKKFLVIISIITDTWKRYNQKIQGADRARVSETLSLEKINLEQAEALWAMRLHPLHAQLRTQPESNIYPLKREQLKTSFPGQKTLPRNALVLGRNLFEEYQNRIEHITPDPPDYLAAFKSIWQKEYKKVQSKITTINAIAEPELIKMLQEVLTALEILEIQPKLLSGRYALYSLRYRLPNQQKNGVVWSETQNMNSFLSIIKGCREAIQLQDCNNLYLLRVSHVGNNRLKGYKIYQKIFNNNHHRHLKPNLTDIHYLTTYHQLVNAAKSDELLILDKTVNLTELESLLRKSQIMSQCSLLQDLDVVGKELIPPKLQVIKSFLLTQIKAQQLIGKQTLIDVAFSNCPGKINNENIDNSLQELVRDNRIKIMNSQAKAEEQIICLIPH